MKGHGAKLSRKMEEAIAALVSHRNVEDAARSIGIAPQTLYRWLKVPEFEAAYREARQALVDQALARLQKASGAAVTILLKNMADQSGPRAVRLKACEVVLSCVKDAASVEEAGARLRRLQQGRSSRQSRRYVETPVAGKPRSRGHGSKFGRKKEQAIAGLLTQRNTEEAARFAGIGVTTLYRWLKDPDFQAEYRAARVAAFAQAGVRLQQATGPAVTTILNIMIESGSSPAAQVRASTLALKFSTGASREDVEEWLRELRLAHRPGPPGHNPPPEELARSLPNAA